MRSINVNPEVAKILMDDFCARTGIIGDEGSPDRRYLWTDAFAVQALFALSHIFNTEKYRNYALRLVDMVHYHLGRYHNDDTREGWISGLPEKEGLEHPTINGLRIGKRLPERGADEAFDEMLEWERDGQYFHYLTRWFNTLVQTYAETGEERYSLWAAELIKAGEKFLYESGDGWKMYWKMNIDLSRPAVESMGAHDPLEGLICAHTASMIETEKGAQLKPMISKFDLICQNMNWVSSDPLGTGGLLLLTGRAADLQKEGVELPFSCQVHQLLEDCLDGLKIYKDQYFRGSAPAINRLAFRECGLSLGIRVLSGISERYGKYEDRLKEVSSYLPLGREIEDFWSTQDNQYSPTWIEHRDINAVSLASSIASAFHPESFCACSF